MKLKTLLLAIVGSVALLVSSPAWSGEAVNINTASVQQLQSVKGIGPKLARAIVKYRDSHGPFKSVDSLLDVKGIGEVKLERIRAHINVKKSAREEKRKSKERERDRRGDD